MKTQDISALVTRYYDGDLSIEEESKLKYYLDETDSSEFAEIKSHIKIMDELANEDDLLGDDFDEKILESINETSPRSIVRYNNQKIISGIAATALLLISIWIVTNIMGTKEVYGTVNDPAIAFNETKKALQKVSKNVRKGVSPASTTIKKIDDGIDKTKEVKKASKAIDNIKNINRLNSPSQLLKSMTKVTVKYGKL